MVCVCRIPDWSWEQYVRYHYWPSSDSRRVLPAGLESNAETVTDMIELHGRTVMIYCDSGRNRSNLLAAMVVRQILACTGKEAIQHVRNGRPMALKNPLFLEYLESL